MLAVPWSNACVVHYAYHFCGLRSLRGACMWHAIARRRILLGVLDNGGDSLVQCSCSAYSVGKGFTTNVNT
jgi:hypothetical protein